MSAQFFAGFVCGVVAAGLVYLVLLGVRNYLIEREWSR